jgi:2-dehydropantoate 2-reductase
MALTDKERVASVGSAGLAAKHALLLAVGLRYRRLRSSMLSAIERGRTPAIDFLNGEVVARAREHGIDAQVNALIVDTIWSIARGEESSDRALLDRIFETTTSTSPQRR